MPRSKHFTNTQANGDRHIPRNRRFRTHCRLHALTSSREHCGRSRSGRPGECYLKCPDKHYCKRTALTSPIFASLYAKGGQQSRPPSDLFCVPRRNEVDRRQFCKNGDRHGFLVSTKKLKRVRFHVVPSHGTAGAMSSWYETKTRYERGARVEETRRARLSAACFGRRLRTGLARIEPTAH